MDNTTGTFSLGTKRLYMVLVVAWTLAFVLASCAANTWVYDRNGDVIYHIKTDGKAVHNLKVDNLEIETDSKTEPLLKFDLNASKVGK